MTVPQHSNVDNQATADSPALGTEPADEQGEQWHGVHSNPQEGCEPRRQPGGVQRTVTSDGAADQDPADRPEPVNSRP